MGISYQATCEWFDSSGKRTILEMQFFTSKRSRLESPKQKDLADKWISSRLREHGTHNCRMTLSKVLFCM